jgi:HlyD family secretion protein
VDPSTTTTTTTAPVSTTVPSDALAACQQALNDVLTAQKAVQTAQASLVDASKTYDQLLAQRAANAGSGSTPSGSTPSAGTTGDAGAGGSGTTSGPTSGGFSGSTGSSGSAPSSSDLVAFQKAVDAAQDQVAVAQQELAQATIASPIEGTVVAVTLAPGDSVSAASTTANVVVKGNGGFQATTSVSVTKIAKVKVGQSATVLPDGAKTPVTGTVVAISAAPTSSTSSSTTYRVAVALDATKETLQNGATADLTIVTDATKSGLAVPTSAITTAGSRHTVTVLDGDGTRVVTVQVGAVGPTWTVVKSGLQRGQQVVLADNGTPLPNSATSSSNSTTGTGNFPGGGSFPGGGNFPGGRTN